jgi:DNA-binding response OmpR family regulator
MARILVVEDNPHILERMTYLLSTHGHQVSSAPTGSAAVDAAGTAGADLVLLDLQLPDVDGYQVLRTLRARQALVGVKIIAVTAVAMVGDRERTLAAGFDHYIPKPINPRTFLDEVEAWLPAALRDHRRPAVAGRHEPA